VARESGDDPAVQRRAAQARASGYGAPQVMRDYLYLRVRHSEPWDLLYWAVGGTAIVNLNDGSASLIPELSYAGIANLEVRARLAALTGGRNTEFGERQNDWRLEIRARYSF